MRSLCCTGTNRPDAALAAGTRAFERARDSLSILAARRKRVAAADLFGVSAFAMHIFRGAHRTTTASSYSRIASYGERIWPESAFTRSDAITLQLVQDGMIPKLLHIIYNVSKELFIQLAIS